MALSAIGWALENKEKAIWRDMGLLSPNYNQLSQSCQKEAKVSWAVAILRLDEMPNNQPNISLSVSYHVLLYIILERKDETESKGGQLHLQLW